MADERCEMWTWVTVPAGMLPVGALIHASETYCGTWSGRIRTRRHYDSEYGLADRVYVDWDSRVKDGICSTWSQPEISATTDVDAYVPVPFDLTPLLAAIKAETVARSV
jgi:hypothetical protein